MKILIIGSTGKIGRLLVPKLLQDGHQVIALARAAAKAEPLERAGAEIRLGDIESDFPEAFRDVEAVVFTAGSGASTGKDKTLTVDLWGALQAIRHCRGFGVKRFVMISALKAENPNLGSEALKPYLVAKHAADEALKASGLDYTILRPGRLTDEPATGKLAIAERLEDYEGSITREDVAEAVRHTLGNPKTIGHSYDLLNGTTPIAKSLLADY